MLKNLIAWLFDLLLSYFGLERTARRVEKEKEALDETVARADLAGRNADRVRFADDPDNRDNRQ